MGGNQTSVKKERRWLKKAIAFTFYIVFEVVMQIVIINSQFDLFGYKTYESPALRLTGWGYVAVVLVAVFIAWFIKKQSELSKDGFFKELMAQFPRPLIMIVGYFAVGMISNYQEELRIILFWSFLTQMISAFFGAWYISMKKNDMHLHENEAVINAIKGK